MKVRVESFIHVSSESDSVPSVLGNPKDKMYGIRGCACTNVNSDRQHGIRLTLLTKIL